MPSASDLCEPPSCVLYWCLPKRTAQVVTSEHVVALHAELNDCAELLDAKVLEVSATYGSFQCFELEASSMSAPDAAVRLGQLLCRWATVQEPELGLRAGVATGQLQSLAIQGAGIEGYWGTALTSAKELAEHAPGECCVHINASTRQSLLLFERLPFSVTGEGSYFLDPWVPAIDADGLSEMAGRRSQQLGDGSLKAGRPAPKEAANKLAQLRDKTMSLIEFGEFLQSMGVDVDKFGRGQAKQLEAFYKDVLKSKCYLLIAGHVLERRVALVRIILNTPGSDGVDRTLKVGMEIMDDGRTRTRNQKLAVTVVQGQTSREAVVGMFATKFGVPSADFDKHFVIEILSDEKESLYSPSVPDIKTVYLTTEVKIGIRQIDAPEMRKLGLPAFENFCTKYDGRTSHWSWKGPDEALSNADMLSQLLHDHHISVADIGDAAFQALEEEVYEEKMSTLTVTRTEPPELLRHLEIVKVWITAEILSVPHVLVMRSKMQFGHTATYSDRPISMRMSSALTWEQAVTLAVTKRLGLDQQTQTACLVLDPHSYKLTEEVEYSKTYPGLKTVYRIHQVALQATDIHKLVQLGLPEGTDFMVIREAMDKIRPEQGRDDVQPASWLGVSQAVSYHNEPSAMGKAWSISTRKVSKNLTDSRVASKAGPEERVVLRFGWQQADDCQSFARDLPAFTHLHSHDSKKSRKSANEYKRNIVDELVSKHGSTPPEPDRKRRVPAPDPIDVPSRDVWKSSYAVAEIMRGKATDWARAKNAARRIRDPDYNVGMFLDDCREAFPELQLYRVDSATSSGRSGDDEYQRTIGALFAVFWLMRLHLDGGQSFAYGVSDEWLALSKSSPAPRRSAAEMKQRETFLDNVKWSLFEDTLVSAGLLKGPPGALVHDEGRVLAMLVLTAIHDIMKVEALLPTVDDKVGNFSGYKVGETISDHDIALGYILEHVPDALPSYKGLPKEQQAPVKFTQCSMEYNMGWLVQAEAPPGPLFGKFRQIIRAGGASPADISFYFVHWLTDLAGAEPCPIEGCEKFVLKFPQRVLASFLGSFDYVKKLDSHTETQVFEDYLQWRWHDHSAPKKAGKGSLAQLRLTVMANTCHADKVLEAYGRLPKDARNVLDTELARSGCRGQKYTLEEPRPPGGPAFLVYYGPALLQKHSTGDNLYDALMVLAEVLRQARGLWPLEEAAAGSSVTVRVDSIKDADLEALVDLPVGQCWALHRTNAKEAAVKKLVLMGEDGSPEIVDLTLHRILKFVAAEERATCPLRPTPPVGTCRPKRRR